LNIRFQLKEFSIKSSIMRWFYRFNIKFACFSRENKSYKSGGYTSRTINCTSKL